MNMYLDFLSSGEEDELYILVRLARNCASSWSVGGGPSGSKNKDDESWAGDCLFLLLRLYKVNI